MGDRSQPLHFQHAFLPLLSTCGHLVRRGITVVGEKKARRIDPSRWGRQRDYVVARRDDVAALVMRASWSGSSVRGRAPAGRQKNVDGASWGAEKEGRFDHRQTTCCPLGRTRVLAHPT